METWKKLQSETTAANIVNKGDPVQQCILLLRLYEIYPDVRLSFVRLHDPPIHN